MNEFELICKILDELWSSIRITFAEPWEVPWFVPEGERDDYEIYLLERGEGKFIINGREHPVSKGDVMLIYTGFENAFVSDTDFRFSFVTFETGTKSELQRSLNSLLLYGAASTHLADIQPAMELFHELQREFCLKADNFMMRSKLLLGDIIFKILGEAAPTGSDSAPNRNANEYINRCIMYIQKHYNSKITLAALADEVSLNPGYLCSLFRAVSGKNISELIRDIRIERAKRLLSNTRLSVTEIAMEVGCCDSQYFSRIFLKSEGMTPSAYRRLSHKI